MISEEKAFLFLLIFVSLLFFLPLKIGMISHSALVGILIGIGIMLAWVGTPIEDEVFTGYIIMTILSLTALGIAVWLSRLAGGWWWTGVWLAVASVHWLAALLALKRGNGAHMIIASIFGVITTMAAFILPWLVAPLLQGQKTTSPVKYILECSLLGLSFITLEAAWYQGRKESDERAFAWLTIIAVGLLAGATWLAGFEGGWWWSVPWVLAAIVLAHAAIDLRQYSFGRGAGNLGLIIAALCLIFAIFGPNLLLRYVKLQPVPLPQVHKIATPTATMIPLATPSPTPPTVRSATKLTFIPSNGWQALSGFIGSAWRSAWGIFHLLTLFILGHLWLRRRGGGLLVLFLMLLTVWLAGATNSPLAKGLTHFFSSSPATWLYEMLLFSINHWGNMAPGIFLTAYILTTIGLPVLRISIKYAYIFKRLLDQNVNISPQFFMERLLEDMTTLGLKLSDNVAVAYLSSAMFAGSWIALWIGLRRVASIGHLPLGFAFLPDLTVPNWKPVGNFNYYLLGILLWLLSIPLLYLQKKYNPLVGCINPLLTFVGAIITASICPAGVVLFSLGLMMAQMLYFPVYTKGISEEVKRLRKIEIPPRPRTAPSVEPSPRPAPPVEPLPRSAPPVEPLPRPAPSVEPPPRHAPSVKPLPRSTLPVEPLPRPVSPVKLAPLVWSSPSPLISMLDLIDTIWLLAEPNFIYVYSGDVKQISLPLQKSKVLLPGREETADREGEVLVVGDNVVLLIGRETRQILKRITLPQSPEGFAINPFKTMLAWANSSTRTVGGLFFETEREIILAQELDIIPVLAFSSDGRYLAIGGSNGDIYLIDIAKRQVTASLVLPELSPSKGKPVIYLFGRKNRGWVSVYKDKRVVFWSSDRNPERELSPQRRKLHSADFHAETGYLALGLSGGILRVFDSNLNKIFDDTVQEKEITHVIFSRDGRQVFTIGNRTEIRRVDL